MRKAIAIDFDGCICTDAFRFIGKPNWPVIELAKREQESGAGLILWTCREGPLLQIAVEACRKWGLEFDAINESLPDWIEEFGNRPRKVGASEYWDDKAVQMPGLLAFMIGGQALAHAGEGPLKDCGPCPHADDRMWCHMYCLKMARAHDPTKLLDEIQQLGGMDKIREVMKAPNDPLTMDELLEMDGEPVWAEIIVETVGAKSGWALVYFGPLFAAALQRFTSGALWYEDYGKTWLAYRHRPEEGTK